MIELLSDFEREGEGGFLYEEGSGPRSENFASLEAKGDKKKILDIPTKYALPF